MRKLVGTVLLLLLLTAYALVLAVLAGAVLPGAGAVTQLGFYAVGGLAWVPLAGLIVRWMHGLPILPSRRPR